MTEKHRGILTNLNKVSYEFCGNEGCNRVAKLAVLCLLFSV